MAVTLPQHLARQPADTPPRVWYALAASLVVHAGIATAIYSYTPHFPRSVTPGLGVLTVPSDLLVGLTAPEATTHVPAPQPEPAAEGPSTKPTPPPPAAHPKPDALAAAPLVGEMGPKAPLEIEVSPGIDRSDAQTSNWLGAEKGTEHSARQSVTDQPALSRDPGKRGSPDDIEGSPAKPLEPANGAGGHGRGDGTSAGDASGPVQPGKAQGETESRNALEAQKGQDGRPIGSDEGDTDEGARPAPAPPPTDVPAQPVTPEPVKPTDTTGLMPAQDLAQLMTPTPVTITRKPEHIPAQLREANDRVDPAVMGAPVAVPAGGGEAPESETGSESKIPGNKSDAESPATSREISLKFRPGMPIAQEGVRLRPKLPRFTMTTRALSVPNNPLVVMKFNRAGKVVKAEFAPGRSTGSNDWDAPLLASLYEWTATGKKLQELPTSDPDAVLVIKMEYLLHD